jgi:hypothetical protein
MNMFKNGIKYMLFGLLGIGLISFLVTLAWMLWVPYMGSVALKPSSMVTTLGTSDITSTAGETKELKPALLELFASPKASGGTGAVITNATEIIRENRYKLCGHVDVGIPVKDPALLNLSINQLTNLYTAQDGWEVVLAGPDRVILRMNIEGLCPQCSIKRHLGVIDGRVAIFYGPAGYRGALDRLTNLNVSSLPIEWQEPIKMKMMEFENSEALVQALDNLDEFR